MTLVADIPAQGLFTSTVTQTALNITAWSGCTPALYQQQVSATNPIAYLRMQPTLLTESDIGTSGGDWKWSSAPTSAAGALTCDTNPAVEVTSSKVLSSEGADAVTVDSVPFSYALWIKAAAGAEGVVFSSAAGLTSSGASVRADRALFLRSNGTLAVGMADGPQTTALTSTKVIADNTWHFVVVTLKVNDVGNGRGLRLYIDGTQDSYSNTMRKGAAPAANESWRLGPATLDSQLGALIPSGTFAGSIDESRCGIEPSLTRRSPTYGLRGPAEWRATGDSESRFTARSATTRCVPHRPAANG